METMNNTLNVYENHTQDNKSLYQILIQEYPMK